MTALTRLAAAYRDMLDAVEACQDYDEAVHCGAAGDDQELRCALDAQMAEAADRWDALCRATGLDPADAARRARAAHLQQ